MLTQELVQEKFNYNKYTGILTRNSASNRKVGTVDSHGYIRLTINYKKYRAHRVIFLHVNGFLPEYVDHIDGDRLNNKIENLRYCSLSQNSMNSKVRSDSKSGVKGVMWHKASNRWRGYIRIGGRNKQVGSFKNIVDAEMAIKAFRAKYHGEFCNHGC